MASDYQYTRLKDVRPGMMKLCVYGVVRFIKPVAKTRSESKITNSHIIVLYRQASSGSIAFHIANFV